MNFIRLNITTEGQTEARFVKRILVPHLGQLNISANAYPVLTSKDTRHGAFYRGGLRRKAAYRKVREDITTRMKSDNHRECRFTTMFDLYALPDDFPGYNDAIKKADPYERVEVLEMGLAKDIGDPRFIPYIQLHEFETLVFAEPLKLACEYLEHERAIGKIAEIVGSQNPELINDGPLTAPSKRILKEIPEYDKANAGPLVIEKIGIENLRSKCRHFREWLEKLERLIEDRS